MTQQENVVSMMDHDPLIQSLRDSISLLGLTAEAAWKLFAQVEAPGFPECKPADEARLHRTVARALRVSGAKNLDELCSRLEAEGKK